MIEPDAVSAQITCVMLVSIFRHCEVLKYLFTHNAMRAEMATAVMSGNNRLRNGKLCPILYASFSLSLSLSLSLSPSIMTSVNMELHYSMFLAVLRVSLSLVPIHC